LRFGCTAAPSLNALVTLYHVAASGCDFAGLDLVDIAPHPTLSRLDGTHQRVLRFVEVLGSVLVLGRVTTSHLTTTQAETQVNPRIAEFHAVFANVCGCRRDFDLVEVCALLLHDSPFIRDD
jgi:hypothetical protein